MGQVFRATDTKLKRQVAIKILPPSLAADHDRLARFQREAEVLASLNHPNIAAIYGLEESGGATALVMELVEGEELSAIIARGPIHVAEALPMAKQIAEALEGAHEQGIIHRDLKPANIKVRPDGTVKVLDFGLAKAMAPVGSAPDVSQSPTITTPAMMTGVGVILGTAAYMSPEQARGKTVDKRADIWAFGAVLYQMLSGRSAFAGETVSDTIVAILEREPDWNALPDATPSAVRRLLQRCLEKDPRRRLHDVADVRIEIEDALAGPAPRSPGPSPVAGVIDLTSSRASPWTLFWAAATVALAVAVIVLAAQALRRPAADLRPLRLSIVPPEGTTFTPKDISGSPQFAVSPDGSRLAFVASSAGARRQLWVQELETGVATPLSGTDDAMGPFWAYDSRRLAFYARGKLKKVSLGGAAPEDLTDVSVDVALGAWNSDEVILFGRGTNDGLFTISATSGGGVTQVTTLDESKGEESHRSPQFLPDGRRFIFYVRSTIPANSGVYLGSIDSGARTQVLASAVNAVYTSSGHLLFEQAGRLMVQPFDAKAGALTGQASASGDRVFTAPGPNYLALSIGLDGTMAYWNGRAGTTQLQWFERNRRPLAKLGPAKAYQGPALSDDGKNLLITELVSSSRAELLNVDLSSGVFSQLTNPEGPFSFGRFGIWSPGTEKEFVYSSLLAAGPRLFRRVAGNADQPLPLGPRSFPEDWSRNGWLIYTVQANTGWDLWGFNFADRKRRPIVEDAKNQVQARFSPSGRWLAYASDERGEWEIYVRPFPEGQKRPIATGSQPLWGRDGKELFYVTADDQLAVIPILDPDTIKVGVSETLFATGIPAMTAPFRTNYAVRPDGQQFLLNSVTSEAVPAPITIAVNWQDKLKN